MVNITFAQNVNTPMPRVPFGSNTAYPFGMMPTNLPTGGTYEGSQDAYDAYLVWYADWVRDCGDGSQYVRWDGGATSVSEGIAYGMIIAVYMGDKTLLDNLWAFYKNAMNNNGLMGWQADCNGHTQSGAATDAEVDAAMALIVAEYQWPTATSPYDYKVEADAIITDIYDHEVQSSSSTGPYQLLPGDAWGAAGNNCRNPGYIPMGYLKSYAEFIGGAQQIDWESNIIPANYSLIQSNVNATTGLASDWCEADGTPGGCGDGGKFGDDASRFPWRSATDALWYGDSRSVTICSNIAKYCAGKGGPASAPGDVNIDGSGSGSTQTIYRVMFGSGVMGADPLTNPGGGFTMQSLVDAYYTNTKNANGLTDQGYFPEILHMLSMLVQTGNFWKPGTESGACTQPDLGADATLCGAGSVSLVSGLPKNNNRTFTWYRNNVVINGPSATMNTLTVTQAGTWKVEVDSANGECVTSDEIEVSGTLPTPDLGPDVDLCVPSIHTLDAGVAGTGINYNWLKDGQLLTASTSTLDVTLPGVYTLDLSASGCSSTSDAITITSSLPVTQGDIRCGTGTVNLEVLSSGGPYEWYSSLTGGSLLKTGTTYSPSISSTTTYYVADAGSIDMIVGLDPASNPLTGEAGRGPTQNEMVLNFDALTGFTLDAISVGYYSFNCSGTTSITINVKNASGGLIGSSSGTVPCSASDPTIGRVILSNPIDIPAGTAHTIDVSGSDRNISWYQNGANYPYGTAGVVSFTGPHTSLLSWAANSHPGFFDWEISTGNNCDRAAVTGTIDCTTGFENIVETGITVYPNPSSDIVYISYDGSIVSIEVSDNSGRLIYNIEDENQLDLSSLEKGIYTLKIVTENGQEVRKLIKE